MTAAPSAALPEPRAEEVEAPRAAVPMPRLGPKAWPVSCTLLTFFLLAACSICETEQKGYCENIITKRHRDKLQELVSMRCECLVSFSSTLNKTNASA
ncbi:hypothetical protein KIL84_007741, partial [Mauremys mutica]